MFVGGRWRLEEACCCFGVKGIGKRKEVKLVGSHETRSAKLGNHSSFVRGRTLVKPLVEPSGVLKPHLLTYLALPSIR